MTDLHIHIIVVCPHCGHEWDLEDYDSPTILIAEDKARYEKCPKCGEVHGSDE